MFFSGYMDKQNVVCPYNGILFGNKKEQTINIKTWTNLKDKNGSERRQSQKISFWMILFTWNYQKDKTSKQGGKGWYLTPKHGRVWGDDRTLRWLWWWWLHISIHMLKLTEPHAKKSQIDCMLILLNSIKYKERKKDSIKKSFCFMIDKT